MALHAHRTNNTLEPLLISSVMAFGRSLNLFVFFAVPIITPQSLKDTVIGLSRCCCSVGNTAGIWARRTSSVVKFANRGASLPGTAVGMTSDSAMSATRKNSYQGPRKVALAVSSCSLATAQAMMGINRFRVQSCKEQGVRGTEYPRQPTLHDASPTQ